MAIRTLPSEWVKAITASPAMQGNARKTKADNAPPRGRQPDGCHLRQPADATDRQHEDRVPARHVDGTEDDEAPAPGHVPGPSPA